jgi:DNA-binding MarR family transcriptional regulator
VSNATAPTFEITHRVRDTCLCLHAQRAARTLARRFDEAFRPLGLTSGQFSLLNALNRPGPAPMRAVATLLAMDRTTLSAALKPLERRELVRVAVAPKDRRLRLLSLTPAGSTLLAAAFPIWRENHDAVEAELGEADPGDLRRGLAALSAPPRPPSATGGAAGD